MHTGGQEGILHHIDVNLVLGGLEVASEVRFNFFGENVFGGAVLFLLDNAVNASIEILVSDFVHGDI